MPARSWSKATAARSSTIRNTITPGDCLTLCRNRIRANVASLRRRVTRLAAALLAVAVVAVRCSPAINRAPETGHNAAIGTTSDINPQDPATLQNGGDLRLGLRDFPPHFNFLPIVGTSAAGAGVMMAL